MLSDGPEQISLDETLARMLSMVDPFVGIIRSSELQPSRHDDARLFLVVTLLSEISGLGVQANVTYGAGVHYELNQATICSIGESLERYCSSFEDARREVSSSARELGERAMDLADFAPFTDQQYRSRDFPYIRVTKDTQLRWARASGPRGEERFVPVQAVYMSHQPREVRLAPKTSSGLALHSDPTKAKLSGLLELVERDAFMIAWHNSLRMPRIDHSGHALATKLYERYYAPAGLRTIALDLSAFSGVPTVMTYAIDDSGEGPRYSFGAASGLTLFSAWEKALREAYHTVSYGRRILEIANAKVYDNDYSDIHTFEEHLMLYARHDTVLNTQFFEDSGLHVDLGATGDAVVVDGLSGLCRLLEDQGVEMCFAETTTEDVAIEGFSVFRAVAPRLVPLDSSHIHRQQGKRRLTHRAYEVGLLPNPLTVDQLSTAPHPFP